MIYAVDPTPAMLHGPHLEVLAVNRMGVLLLDDFAAMAVPERNLLHWMFLSPKARQVYPDWSASFWGDRTSSNIQVSAKSIDTARSR